MEDQTKEKNKAISFVKSNFKIIISFLVILILVFSIYSWLKIRTEVKKNNLSENYIEAKIMISQKKSDEALDILKNIINENDKTYSVLSLYLIIDQKLEKDERKIINYFDKVLSIKSLKNEDSDLIKLKKAIFISSYENEKELLKLLNPIINSDSVWKIQSIKFLADFYFSKKEFNKADQYYLQLLTFENANIDINEIKRKIKTYKK
tara:strand:+ start:207 stop:827 length:621 start_codon:yes stop_codon:yes gene_type:complete